MAHNDLNHEQKRQTRSTCALTDLGAAETAPQVSLISNLNSSELHAGALDFIRQNGGFLDAVALRYPGHLPPAENISGILAALTVPSYLDWVVARNCPVVHMLHTHLALPGWPRVVSDLEAVGRLGAQHLLSLGDIDIAFYRYFDSPDFKACRDGFVSEIEAQGRAVHEIGPRRVYNEGSELKVTRLERINWLKSQLASLPGPLAVMADDDLYAVDLVHAARALGLRIPEDLAILGVDDQPLVLDAVSQQISSIDTDLREIGRVSCELLHRLLQGATPGSDEVPMLVRVPPKGVVVRDSTVTFRCDHAGVTAAALFIRRHFHERIAVSDVAAHARMSVRSLQASYPRRVGCTIKEDIQRQRLRRAQCLLQTTGLKLAAVAVEAGFGTIENLCRIFQMQHRMTPHAWRMRQRET